LKTQPQNKRLIQRAREGRNKKKKIQIQRVMKNGGNKKLCHAKNKRKTSSTAMKAKQINGVLSTRGVSGDWYSWEL